MLARTSRTVALAVIGLAHLISGAGAQSGVANDVNTLLLLRFDGTATGVAGQLPLDASSLTFEPGVIGQGVRIDGADVLRWAVADVRRQGRSRGGELAALAAGLDLEGLDLARIDELMTLAGIDPTALCGEMAEVNRLLDTLPPQATDKIFRVFLDKPSP